MLLPALPNILEEVRYGLFGNPNAVPFDMHRVLAEIIESEVGMTSRKGTHESDLFNIIANIKVPVEARAYKYRNTRIQIQRCSQLPIHATNVANPKVVE